MTGSPYTAARQAALAAEHRAVFGYAVVGARLTGAAGRQSARQHQTAHAALRDGLVAALLADGALPEPAAADYDVYPGTHQADAQRIAVTLETACGSQWRYLYAAAASTVLPTARAVRAEAQTALTACAVRATYWRVSAGDTPATVAFPGL